MKFSMGDYVEGIEHYGNKTKRICGWINKIATDENGLLVISIQCDDEYQGYRGNYIYESLGEIKLMKEQKPKPNIY